MQYQLSRQLLLDEMAFSPNMLLCKETCYPNRSLFLWLDLLFAILVILKKKGMVVNRTKCLRG